MFNTTYIFVTDDEEERNNNRNNNEDNNHNNLRKKTFCSRGTCHFFFLPGQYDGNGHQHLNSHKEGALPTTTKLEMATDEKNSLFHYAQLDTLVTVVDAINIYDVLTSIETLADKDNVSGMCWKYWIGGWKSQHSFSTSQNSKKQQKLKGQLSLKQPWKCQKKVDTTGTKSELVTHLIKTFKEEIFQSYKDDQLMCKLFMDQIEFTNVIIVSKASEFLELNNGYTKTN